MIKKISIPFCFICILVLGAFADWNEGDPFKWLQRPDLSPTGLDICVDDTGANGQRTIGDDFECKQPGPITDVHLWGSWKGDVKGRITGIHVSFYTDIPDPDPQDPTNYSQPGPLLWERWFDPTQFTERLYYTLPDGQYEGWWDPRAGKTWIPNGDTQIWQYNIKIDNEPFYQEGTPDQPIIYWLVVEVTIDKTIENSSFGWKTRDREDGHFMDDAVWFTPTAIPWHELRYPAGDPTGIPPSPPHPYSPDSIDMAFVLTSQTGPVDPDKDYGDAPEGGLAYPASGVMGMFPTCITVGPAGYIEHTNFGAWFGLFVDFEFDGNAGLCPGCFPLYDQDECFDPVVNNSDPGLMFPCSYTIDTANNVVTCPQCTLTSPLGLTCQTAVWGSNIDIWVRNTMPNQTPGYVNVLMDWDQNGQWGGASSCPTAAAPEYVLQDFMIPNGYIGPLSGLMIPGVNDFFTIGPNPDYVWVRFSITERPLQNPNWDGSGSFEDGETEDYLLRVDPDQTTDDLDFGDAPDTAGAPGYPTLLANNGARHLIVAGGPYFDDGSGTDNPDPEADGQPNGSATGDDNDGNDDEDGIVIPPLVVGQIVTITFNVGGPGGIVEAFFDWNADGDWIDAGEAIPPVFFGPGPAAMNVTVPATATPGPTFARFRISQAGPFPMTDVGQALDGEVEDHQVFVEREPDEKLKFQQLPLDGVPIEQFRYFGHDELSTAYRRYDLDGNLLDYYGCYMADDFADREHSPVTRVKWWGSYLENYYDPPFIQVNRFLIVFESDIPAVGKPGEPGYMPSHPGEVLLSQIVVRDVDGVLTPGEFSEINVSPGGPPCNEGLFQYETILEKPFPQRPDTVYWLKIVALVDAGPAVMQALQSCGLPPCELGKLPWQQILVQCPQLAQYPPLVRWGWHNRDYTIMDPFASVPPLVTPGEHIQGTLPDGTNIWHFQDDAVSGEIMVFDKDPAFPFVDQAGWGEEFYRYFWPLCQTPATQGVDGPQEIEQFSKDLAFELWTPTHGPDKDFGDAPEGGVAYPATGVVGRFPTCITTGPAGWIQHTNFGAWFGPMVDFEWDGNAGLCPTCFPQYDQDEYVADGDAGLITPTAHTINGSLNIVPTMGVPLGRPCTPAVWGTNIDTVVTNNMPGQTVGYVNVLIDWDQNGVWSGSSTCSGVLVPEHVLVDFPVPNGFSGPLSALAPTGFTIGPKRGFVWVRISITERPVATSDWDGSGAFEDGETEDYLLRVMPTCQDYNLTKKKGGLADNIVNSQDLSYLITYVNTYKTGPLFVVTSTNPNYDPDYNFTRLEGSTDNIINSQDLSSMINFVNAHKTGVIFVVNCTTCGC